MEVMGGINASLIVIDFQSIEIGEPIILSDVNPYRAAEPDIAGRRSILRI
jgi:hypothetical protein